MLREIGLIVIFATVSTALRDDEGCMAAAALVAVGGDTVTVHTHDNAETIRARPRVVTAI